MDEWREGTLVEMDSDQVNVENVMKDLEKTPDLDYFGQVQFETSQNQHQGLVPQQLILHKGIYKRPMHHL